jgi:phosphatidylserine decarboxylase
MLEVAKESDMSPGRHQYIERETGRIHTERFFGDGILNVFYNGQREETGLVYRLLASPWLSSLLAWATYDLGLGRNITGMRRFVDACDIDLGECIKATQPCVAPRDIFERQIRYWECRPLEANAAAIVSPADARVLIGSLKEQSSIFVKGKFFEPAELFGPGREQWSRAFVDGDFVICRLTPEKYHYNHAPVSGIVCDFYETDGQYHSCNPSAVISLATPYSKNRRAVTLINTNVRGGTGVGLVAMFEVVALMIGDVVQCYSTDAYDRPVPVQAGMRIEKGKPKSLFRPGSSTTVVFFQKDQIQFSNDLVENLNRKDVVSRYSAGLGRPLVETDIKVRSTIGYRKEESHAL